MSRLQQTQLEKDSLQTQTVTDNFDYQEKNKLKEGKEFKDIVDWQISSQFEFSENSNHYQYIQSENSPESIEHWVEWQRIETLCLCLLKPQTEAVEELVGDLELLQQKVNLFRQSGWWNQLSVSLTYNEIDILTCIYAPQVITRIGWLYQELDNQRKPAPSQALIASLLAIPDNQLNELRSSLVKLEKNGLIMQQESSPFGVIYPDKLALSRLMQWTDQDYAPAGSYLIKSQASWQNLVLPDEQIMMLKEYLYWLQYKQKVVNQWQGQKTGGPIAMFTGPSGTGKTLAASVLANELGWPLYRVDLAALVSKYIGETEKNIGRLFDATHGRNVFLQFDEVDALMGKRGELKEARDRYANMEVSYLLARIEEHNGPCILTTNLRSQIDKAFCRRFQMVIEFPRPAVEQRALLWQALLPAKAPKEKNLNLKKVAAAVSLTGGQIRNAALHSAYLAAANEQAINLQHIAIAVYRELGKEQSQVNLNQLGDLAEYINTMN